MNTNLICLSILLITIFSCQVVERDNPFDPECPKQIWTPTNFQAVQEGNAVKLTWSSPTSHISGFMITKQSNDGNIVTLENQPNNVNQFIDSDIIGGIKYTYTILAYAGNNESYPVNVQIKPLLQASVSTVLPSPVGTKTVTFIGSIISNGGSPITEQGFYWSRNINPTANDNKVVVTSGLSYFSETVGGLNPNTNYYVRAYAINNLGLSYGNEQSFTTKGYGTVTDIDGNVYNTIAIGSQVWMVENLKATKYKNGTPIPNVTSSWFNLQTPSYCWYDDDITFKDTYGALYNFYAVNTGILAPDGWHVPTENDWSILIHYLGGTEVTGGAYDVAGGKMKEIGISHWKSPNTDATNSSGFTAVPGGSKPRRGALGGKDFSGIGDTGNWWGSSTASNGPFGITIEYYAGLVYGRVGGEAQNGYSVRCIKD